MAKQKASKSNAPPAASSNTFAAAAASSAPQHLSDLGRTRVIQRRFNVSVPRARVPKKQSTLRERSKR
jgi:hypothetical protein